MPAKVGYDGWVSRVFLSTIIAIGLFYPAFARGERNEFVEAAIARQLKVATYHRTYRAAPKEAALGRKLFFDPRLSLNGKMSCATCHRPERQFSDGLPRAIGRRGKPVTRNTPSLLTATFHRYLFWDGRAETIEEAALTAVQNPDEMAQPLPALEKKLAALPEYAREFAAVYPGIGISSMTIGRAWGAYVISLASPEDSAFDRFLADRTGLSSAALRGYQIFAYKAECIYCHSSRHFNYNSDRYLSIGLKPVPFDDPGRYRVEPSPDGEMERPDHRVLGARAEPARRGADGAVLARWPLRHARRGDRLLRSRRGRHALPGLDDPAAPSHRPGKS